MYMSKILGSIGWRLVPQLGTLYRECSVPLTPTRGSESHFFDPSPESFRRCGEKGEEGEGELSRMFGAAESLSL